MGFWWTTSELIRFSSWNSFSERKRIKINRGKTRCSFSGKKINLGKTKTVSREEKLNIKYSWKQKLVFPRANNKNLPKTEVSLREEKIKTISENRMCWWIFSFMSPRGHRSLWPVAAAKSMLSVSENNTFTSTELIMISYCRSTSETLKDGNGRKQR